MRGSCFEIFKVNKDLQETRLTSLSDNASNAQICSWSEAGEPGCDVIQRGLHFDSNTSLHVRAV
jgi:hypothetical protein